MKNKNINAKKMDKLHEVKKGRVVAKKIFKKIDKIDKRLAELRQAILDENISYGEIAELQSLKKYINKGDPLLLEWAGVPEF